MQFSFEVDRVQEALSFMFDISPPRASSGDPVLVEVCAKDNGDVVFSVVDPSIISIYTINTDVDVSGTAIVSLSSLYKAVSGFVARLGDGNGTDIIKFSKGSQVLTLTARAFYGGKKVSQRRSLQLMDFSLPTLNIPPQKDFVKIPCETVTLSFKHSAFSVASTADTAAFDGVLFELDSGTLKVVSTNGISLTQFICDVSDSIDSRACSLSGQFVSKMSRILSKISPEVEGEPNIGIFIGDNIFWLSYKGLLVGSPLQTSGFPSYDGLISGRDKKFIIDSDIILDNIRNIVFSSDKDDNFRVTLKFFKGEFSIVSSTCSNDDLPLIAGNHGLNIDFNALLIESAIKNVNSTSFILSYKDRNSPVIIEPYESDLNLMCIVAPLK